MYTAISHLGAGERLGLLLGPRLLPRCHQRLQLGERVGSLGLQKVPAVISQPRRETT